MGAERRLLGGRQLRQVERRPKGEVLRLQLWPRHQPHGLLVVVPRRVVVLLLLLGGGGGGVCVANGPRRGRGVCEGGGVLRLVLLLLGPEVVRRQVLRTQVLHVPLIHRQSSRTHAPVRARPGQGGGACHRLSQVGARGEGRGEVKKAGRRLLGGRRRRGPGAHWPSAGPRASCSDCADGRDGGRLPRRRAKVSPSLVRPGHRVAIGGLPLGAAETARVAQRHAAPPLRSRRRAAPLARSPRVLVRQRQGRGRRRRGARQEGGRQADTSGSGTGPGLRPRLGKDDVSVDGGGGRGVQRVQGSAARIAANGVGGKNRQRAGAATRPCGCGGGGLPGGRRRVRAKAGTLAGRGGGRRHGKRLRC
mmetsp:Transcript_22061/g.66028  ORF Transcript_22061/g.66028 Transcript_22061/m.66028 type:complete len:362 (+) Transcript_22061:245-1330(+)